MRVIRAGLAVLLLDGLLALVPTDRAAAATAAEILKWCSTSSPDHSPKLCKSYVGAIAEVAAERGRLEDNLGVACIPKDVSVDRLVSLVVQRVQPSPELADKTGFEVVAPIFIEAFPCK